MALLTGLRLGLTPVILVHCCRMAVCEALY